MKLSLCRVGSALLLGLAFTAMGCQEDNEAAIKDQEAKSSSAAVKTDPNAPPPPKSNAERATQHNSMKNQAPKGYPGVR